MLTRPQWRSWTGWKPRSQRDPWDTWDPRPGWAERGEGRVHAWEHRGVLDTQLQAVFVELAELRHRPREDRGKLALPRAAAPPLQALGLPLGAGQHQPHRFPAGAFFCMQGWTSQRFSYFRFLSTVFQPCACFIFGIGLQKNFVAGVRVHLEGQICNCKAGSHSTRKVPLACQKQGKVFAISVPRRDVHL